jgi:hypothetical protein
MFILGTTSCDDLGDTYSLNCGARTAPVICFFRVGREEHMQ